MNVGSAIVDIRARRRFVDPRAAVSLIVLRLGLFGCQRQAQYPVREPIDGGFGSVSLEVGADDCPAVTFTLSPGVAHIGESISVAAFASDSDPAATLTVSWTATFGLFADPASASTTYECPGRDHAGPQTIAVSVSDGSCVTTKKATISCLALADGGGPATIGAGGAGDAGAGCANADPTTCEGDACNTCTNDNCYTLISTSMNGSVPIAGCDIFVSDDERARCQKLYACMRDSGCVKNSDPSGCWCGSVDTYECETGMTPANGPCVQQFADAAGNSDPTVINDRLTDSRYPLGGAINLAACRSVSCSRLSDPPNPVCSF